MFYRLDPSRAAWKLPRRLLSPSPPAGHVTRCSFFEAIPHSCLLRSSFATTEAQYGHCLPVARTASSILILLQTVAGIRLLHPSYSHNWPLHHCYPWLCPPVHLLVYARPSSPMDPTMAPGYVYRWAIPFGPRGE